MKGLDCLAQAEFYILEYASALMTTPQTWELAVDYLAWCPVHGQAALQRFLEQLPVGQESEDLALKALQAYSPPTWHHASFLMFSDMLNLHRSLCCKEKCPDTTMSMDGFLVPSQTIAFDQQANGRRCFWRGSSQACLSHTPAVQVCQRYGMRAAERGICITVGMERLQQGHLAAALQWLGRAGDERALEAAARTLVQSIAEHSASPTSTNGGLLCLHSCGNGSLLTG